MRTEIKREIQVKREKKDTKTSSIGEIDSDLFDEFLMVGENDIIFLNTQFTCTGTRQVGTCLCDCIAV